MYYQLELSNDSHIGYDIGQVRVYIRDKRKAKRTASQELELQPLFIQGNTQRIDGMSSQSKVVAVDQYNIPDKKYLAIHVLEGNGGRNLDSWSGNTAIIKQ